MVENSTSTVLFPYPNFDVATYFCTSNLKSKALRNAISQLNQEVSTDRRWRENVADSNASRITDLEPVLGNSDPESNIQTTMWNSVAAVG